MTGNIFLLGEDGNLKELREEPYDSEESMTNGVGRKNDDGWRNGY
jgi:hypothetical protein